MKHVINLAIYLMYALPLFLIAVKCGHGLAWLAFVPLANLWLMCDLVDLSLFMVLWFLLPFVGAAIFQATVWMRLSENTNKPAWLGLLMIIPGVSFFVGWYIAVAPS